MAQEVELKLEIDPGNLLLLLQDPLLGGEPRSVDQVTVYYDTAKTALKKHGFTLRVRNVEGRYVQTVKTAGDSVGLLSRGEIEFDVNSMTPDLESLADLPLAALVADGQLVPVIRSDVTRTSSHIELAGSLIQLDVDCGSITAGKRVENFAEAELELIEGTPASLVIAARRLADRVPVRLGILTKAERGFRLAEGKHDKVSKAGPVHVHRGMTIAEAFEMIVHACLKHYRLNEPLVIRQCKGEALHQTRVAMRRLRSAFSLFKPAVEDVEFQHLRHEIRWFTGQLGDARNIDVYLKQLDKELRGKVMEARDRAYVRVADAMNSQRFRRLLVDIVGWTAIGSWRSAKPASRPITPFANLRLDKLWRTVEGAGPVAAMDETSRHQLRIQVKKIRYATEFLEGLYPEARRAEKAFGKAVEKLQEELGKLNDLATARGFGREIPDGGRLTGSNEERRHLRSAEEALSVLLKIGEFWRTETSTREPAQQEASTSRASGSLPTRESRR